jgi:hypothetical protein
MARTFVNARHPIESPAMHRLARGSFAAIGLGLLALTIGFGFRQDWATRLWVWDDQRMNFIFLASIAAAVAAPALWVAVSGEFAAWAGVAINGVVVGILASSYLLSRVLRDELPDALFTALVFLALTPLALLAFRVTHPISVRDTRPNPGFVRWWFIAFAAILVGTGAALIFQVENVFPWRLDPPVSTLFGCFFLGASAYFVYALRRPQWVIAAGALWSFLAYDIVLAIPYLKMLGGDGGSIGYSGMYGASGYGNGDGVNEVSLVPYLIVLGVSAGVAVYAFFINVETRIWGRYMKQSAVDPPATQPGTERVS